MSRILRSLVCLLLICCILVNLSPLKTDAMELMSVGFATVSVAVAVACAFQALGVMSASNSSGFTTTVDNCTNWLSQNSNLVVNGTVALLGLTQDGVTTSYLSKNFIQTVWEWLYSSKTVQKQELSISSSVTIPAEAFATAAAAPYSVFVTTEKVASGYRSYILAYSYQSPIVAKSTQSDGTGHSVYTQVSNAVAYLWSSTAFFEVKGTIAAGNSSNRIVSVQRIGTSDPIVYETTQELSLGSIQSPYQTTETEEETIQIEIAPIYIDWTKYGVPDPNNPETPPEDDPAYRHWLPTGIPSVNFDDSVITQTQQQAQSGTVTGDLTFTPSGSNSGTGTDPDPGTNTNPDSGSSGAPSKDMEFFALDLKEFFPFCIPFDLYDFFTCLNADPVAPVIEWVIPLPGGDSYPLELDLSTFDPVAQLLRRLQLLLFCVGLAFKTRDLIKG